MNVVGTIIFHQLCDNEVNMDLFIKLYECAVKFVQSKLVNRMYLQKCTETTCIMYAKGQYMAIN